MPETREGYIDPNREDDMLKFFLERNRAQEIPDQRTKKGTPPQAGVSCPKCAYRNRPGVGEAFGATKTPTFPLSFAGSKNACERVIEQSRKQPHKIDASILNSLIYQNEFEEEHVAHVAAIETPGIVAFMAFKVGSPFDPIVLCYLVDGTHRAVAAIRAGRDFWAYVLTPRETLQCLSHINDKPNPSFVGNQGNILFDGHGAIIPLETP